MTRHKVEFRQATAKDAKAFYGHMPMKTMRGFVAVLDGEPIGIGGIFYDSGAMVAFSEMKDEYRARKKDVARGIRLLCQMFDDLPGDVFAAANRNEPTAKALLTKLGFMNSGLVGPAGEILVRSNA